jgi:4-carboxymuconolactone decarboxylase
MSRVKFQSGGRLPPLHPGSFTPDQKRTALEISNSFGGKVDGPFSVWIRVPEIAEKACRLITQIRTDGKLERRLFELLVLITARHYKAQFEWSAHESSALREGVSKEVVEAIRTDRVPTFSRRDEQVVYDVVVEINRSGTLSRETFDLALTHFSQELLIELVTAAGSYTMVAILLNAFDAPVPRGRKPRLS